ncbi:hypothetical protein [Spirosoma fluviale]|uniref:Uncharacterized protein n=1 Tax=Spirosoma fluviale TaxID=1597977 RepID=A0A286FGV8_9BACT|nr:hypothetical protein [Spirosoma fluviale]SOD82477.1 hypothetical protein SAMN06269250_2153 [Spirosoma fluviale]
MQTHDELVEAVFNNPSYRSEVLCIIKLRATLESALEELSEPAKPEKPIRRMLRYDDLIGKSPIIQFADSPEINRCRHGITLLYSALAKGIMHTHSLSTQQANKVLLDVVTRYTNR